MATTLLVLALAIIELCLANPIFKRQTTCYSGAYIILAPPHGNTGPGLQQTLVNNVTSAIPNSGVYVVPYNSSTIDYGVGIANGQQLMVAEIESYAGSCPNGVIVLMGYSEGGIVMMNSLCGSDQGTGQLPTQYVPNIAAAIAYAEETFVPGQSYDRGTCTIGPSENPRPNPASCDPFASSILSYCNSGDQLCCNGTDPNGHYEYQQYDVAATNFVVQQYNSHQQ